MVDATLKALHTAFGLDHYDFPSRLSVPQVGPPSSYPLDANFLYVILKPNNPGRRTRSEKEEK